MFLWRRGWRGIDLGAGDGEPRVKPVEKSRHHAVMGIVIQSAVESFYNDELWRKPQDLKHRLTQITKAAFAKELAENYIDWRASPDQSELEQVCIDGVIGYLRTMKHHKFLGPYARAEVKMKGWIDKWNEVAGYADTIVRRDDTGITIIDGKNSKTKNKYVDPDQLRYYAMVFYLTYDRTMPDRLAFVWYRYPYDGKDETGVEWVECTKQDIQRMARRAVDVRKKMNKQLFDPTPSSASCRFCDYETVCAARQAMKKANRRKPKVSLPVVDGATDFVEFDLNTSVQNAAESGSKT